MKPTEIFSSPCHCVNIRRAAQALTEYYDRALAPLNLSISQYSILANLKAIEPCSVTDLSRRTRLDRTTLVRNLKPLSAGGLVCDLAADGKRSRQLMLTDRGIAVWHEAKGLWKKAQTDVESYLGADTVQAITSVHLKIEKLIWEGNSQ